MNKRYRCELALPILLNQKDFAATYQDAFGGAPYFEEYTQQEVVDEVLEPHFSHGMVMVATDQSRHGKLIGFGCALPFKYCPDDVREFVETLAEEGRLPQEFDYRHSWYMSELGVRQEYRGEGAAWELVLHRMHTMLHRGAKQYFMRTAAVGSMSMPMYIKCGASPLDAIQDVSSTIQATENHTHALQRMYLWGDCREAAEAIRRIKDERGYIPFASPDLGMPDLVPSVV